MNTVAIIVVVVVIVILLAYYFLIPKQSPQFFSSVKQTTITLSAANPNLTVTTSGPVNTTILIGVFSSTPGNYVAKFNGSTHTFSRGIGFFRCFIPSGTFNTLYISGFGTTYSLTIHFLGTTTMKSISYNLGAYANYGPESGNFVIGSTTTYSLYLCYTFPWELVSSTHAVFQVMVNGNVVYNITLQPQSSVTKSLGRLNKGDNVTVYATIRGPTTSTPGTVYMSLNWT